MKTYLQLLVLTVFIMSVNLFGQESCYQFPTFAEPPGPENVLVVFNQDDQTSIIIKDYYMDKRGIPVITHKKGITLPPASGITFEHGVEIIKGEGLTAWNYVKENITDPIESNILTQLITMVNYLGISFGTLYYVRVFH
jgi:hypothetical protein